MTGKARGKEEEEVVYVFTLSHYSTCLAKTFLSWNTLFYAVKHRFCGMLQHPKVFISVK